MSSMLITYKAILRDNHLEWQSDSPPDVPKGYSLKVHVTILDESPAPTNLGQGEQMALALEPLALSQVLSGLDAAQSEREERTERKESSDS